MVVVLGHFLAVTVVVVIVVLSHFLAVAVIVVLSHFLAVAVIVVAAISPAAPDRSALTCSSSALMRASYCSRSVAISTARMAAIGVSASDWACAGGGARDTAMAAAAAVVAVVARSIL